MTSIVASLAPPNSLVLLGDPLRSDIPDSMRKAVISASKSCIAIGCKAEIDGQTVFILGDREEVQLKDSPAFEGTLETPNQALVLRTVMGQVILEMPVAHTRTNVRIWINDPKEPDEVVIGVG